VLNTQQTDGNVSIPERKISHMTIHTIHGTKILIERKDAFVGVSIDLKPRPQTSTCYQCCYRSAPKVAMAFTGSADK